jgi:DNA-binding IclR family transcriptional regulator|tara:strand:- start:25528 stop:26310 length:783 start_codon:yes stop_codon:yes gene_type:complete
MTSSSGSGDRILAIIDLYTQERSEWLPEDMMQALGYSRPTLYRYLKSLKDAGFLVSLPNRGFALGPRVTELDFLMHRTDRLIDLGRPAIKDLARQFSCSAFITRWYGEKLLCVTSEVSAPKAISSYPRGRPMPLGRGAISHVIIANLPKLQRDELVARYCDEFKCAGWGTSEEEIQNDLLKVRRRGFAVARGEVTKGVIGIAAPILSGKDSPDAALCLTIEQSLVDDAFLKTISASLSQHARTISIALNSITPNPSSKNE